MARSGHTIAVAGSAIDPDTTGEIKVALYVNGSLRTVMATHGHWYGVQFQRPYGSYRVTAVALNVASGTGNTVLGSRIVALVDPAAHNPRAAAMASRSGLVLSTRGYARDPDRPHRALMVRVFNNGRAVGGVLSNSSTYLFGARVRLHYGTNSIRVIAYNVSYGTGNTTAKWAIFNVPRPAYSNGYSGNQAIAASMLASYGWSQSEMGALIQLWNRESGWNVFAANASSGAYGIPQALPGSKMGTAGGDWQTSARTQIRWGLGYIKSRFGSPSNAWAHEVSQGWY